MLCRNYRFLIRLEKGNLNPATDLWIRPVSEQEVVHDVFPGDPQSRRVVFGFLVARGPRQEASEEVPHAAEGVRDVHGEREEREGLQDVTQRRPKDTPRLHLSGSSGKGKCVKLHLRLKIVCL